MAIATMKKMRIVGLRIERDEVMSVLSGSKSFELINSVSDRPEAGKSDIARVDRMITQQVKLSFAIDYLKELSSNMTDILKQNEKDVKKGRAEKIEFEFAAPKKDGVRPIIGYDDLYDSSAKEYELLAVADSLEKISFSRVDNKAARQKLLGQIKSYSPYKFVTEKLSTFSDTRFTTAILAHSPRPQYTFNIDFDCVFNSYAAPSGVCVALVCHKDDKDEAISLLTERGFSICPFNFDMTMEEKIAEANREIERLKEEDFELIKEGLGYLKHNFDMKVLYDFIALEAEKAHASFSNINTESAYLLEGWVPAAGAENLEKQVKSAAKYIAVEFAEPSEEEEPPTLMDNPKVLQPFEDVTNLYSPPSYREPDPTFFMAVFFFIFFGIMSADAGYGIVTAIVAALAVKFIKFESGTKRLIMLIGICSISTIVWGVLFGGYFGLEDFPLKPIWFNPIEDPIMMLILSIIVGIVHLMVGYGFYAYKCFKRGDYASGILDVIFIYTIIFSVAFLALWLVLGISWMMTVGSALLIVSLVGILLTAGHAKKGIGAKILGGFAGLYGLINLLSDALSYARLFGLGLASAAIGMAFNTLGFLLFDIPVIGYAVGLIILIPLHVFNLALGLLSAYVHNARLQYIEFYGKFYDGGGRLFAPMGECTRFTRVRYNSDAKE